MTSTTGSMSKVEMIDREMRERYRISLAEWVRHKLDRGVAWRQIEKDLQVAIGADRLPITRQGLMRWWRQQEDA